MTFATLLNLDRATVVSTSKVLSPDEVLDIQTSLQLIEQCKKECAEQRAAAQADRLAQARSGYEEGRAKAAVEFAQCLAHTHREIASFWRSQEDELVKVMTGILHRMAPSLQAQGLIRDLVTTGLQELQYEARLAVRVHPGQLEAAHAALKEWQTQHPLLNPMDVTGDDCLAPTDCLIESPNGFVNTSWKVQVHALSEALRGFAAHALQDQIHAAQGRLTNDENAKSPSPAQANPPDEPLK